MKNRKKVLFLITKSNWGGAQRYVYDIATNLPREDFDVTVACGDTGLLVKKLREESVRTIEINSFQRNIHFLKEIKAFLELLSIYNKEKPDVVHLNSSKAGGIGALAARLSGSVKNIIFTSHGLPWDEDRNILSRALIFFSSYLTFLLCSKVITISENDFRRVRRLPLCSNKTALIRNGITAIAFKSREDARREIIGTPIKNSPWIGTIGEFTRNKGLIYLVHAATILKNRGLTFRMSLVGDGEELPEIKKLALQNKLYNDSGSTAYIDLPGFVPDFARNLKAFEIFILTSVKEGLPYVLLEAGQAGLPVIASHVGGIPEIIEHKRTGLLTEPKNVEQITDAIQELIENPELRKQYGAALKQHVQTNFRFEDMLEKTYALYESRP